MSTEESNIQPFTAQEVVGAKENASFRIANSEMLQIDAFQLTGLTTVLVDLSSFQNDDVIDGIIGYDLLANHVCRIDCDKNEIVLYNDVSEIENPYKNVLDLSFDNNIMIPQINVSIALKDGQSFQGKVLMDSGARSNFVLNSNTTRDHELLEAFERKYKSSFLSLTGKEENYEVAVESLSFANEMHKDVSIDVPLSKQGVNTYSWLLGILGNGIMKRYNWIFDYKNSKVYYQHSQYNALPFHYPMTNFKIKKDNGKMIFVDVQPNSREAKAAIKEGMEITTVNGLQIEHYDEIKRLLQSENERLKINYFTADGTQKKIKVRTVRKI